MTRRQAAGVAVAVALAATLTACADYVGDDVRAGEVAVVDRPDPERAGPTTTTVPPAPIDPRTLEVGSCFDDVAGPEGEQPATPDAVASGAPVTPRTCQEEHRYELYARADVAGPEAGWPGDQQVGEDADRECVTAFEAFVGTPWAESTLDYVVQRPDEARWAAGDRVVSCALFELGLVPLEGSMAGARR